MNKEDVIHGLKTLAKQERKAQSLLTGPREAPQEFERWYIAEVLESAVLIIEQRDRLAEAATVLIAAKGRHNTMLAYQGLRESLAAVKGGGDDRQPTKDETEDGSPKVGSPPRRRGRRER